MPHVVHSYMRSLREKGGGEPCNCRIAYNDFVTMALACSFDANLIFSYPYKGK